MDRHRRQTPPTTSHRPKLDHHRTPRPPRRLGCRYTPHTTTPVITITTWPIPHTRLDGASCEWHGQQWRLRAPSAVAALARTLTLAGCPDGPWQALGTAGNRLFYGNSIHGLAQLALREDNARLRWRRFSIES